ncbi:MAG TPA: OmpA family protein [Verrucomicrobiota bacterium]|nr:OmpA family protein [Verrucomicrobiota bacterium]HNU52124.1 OmpA family protein [Verrucomicrobiota bacterium]
MKRALLLNLFAVVLALALGGVGCKKPQKPVTQIPIAGAKGGPGPGGTTRVGPTEGGARSPTPDNVAPVQPDTGVRATPVETTPVKEGPSGIEQAPIEMIEGMVPDTEYFKAQTVYFEFDSSVVRKTQHGRCDAVGDELKAKPEAKLMIDGHCDERGTEEYNRALGERRALAVRTYLIKYGIAADRVFTRSWGENRPADPGQNEDAYAKNRRGEFILLLPKP